MTNDLIVHKSPCKWCNGSGVNVIPHPRYGDEVIDCPDCEGTGTLANSLGDPDCQKCNGRGYAQSEMRHENQRQSHAWASMCECAQRKHPKVGASA